MANPYHLAMPRRLVSPTLVGRETELAAMARALDSAAAGAPVHRLVAGEAGVGKSRLVAEAAALATARGMRVVIGGCADVGHGGVPYGPIVEALRTLVRTLEPEVLDAVVGGARDDLSRLVPTLGHVDGSDARQTETVQPRLFDAILGVFQRLAEIEPVVFVVEDLHWADPATRETISFLIRQLRSDRVVLVMTFRSDELHRRHPLLPWLAELDRSGLVERVDLDRLDASATHALLAAILEAPPSPDLVEQIHRRSDGNPFFVEELLGAGTDAEGGRLPPTLREVLLARIVALPEHAQTVIGVAAVAGGRVDHALLAHVAGLSETDLLDGLRDAVGSQILVAAGSVRDGAGRRLRVPPRAAPGGGLRRPPAGRTAATPPSLRRGAGRARGRDWRDRGGSLGRARLPLVGRPGRASRVRGIGARRGSRGTGLCLRRRPPP